MAESGKRIIKSSSEIRIIKVMRESILFKTLFVLAVLAVGAVYSVLPHFVRYITLKDQGLRYIPVTLNSTFDYINHYGTRYRDIVDGNLFPGEIDTYEHKDGPSFFPVLEATILAPFFLPFETLFPGFIITDFLFPILFFITLFLIFYRFTERQFLSLFSAYTLMLFPLLPTLIPPSSLTELKILFFQFIPFSGTSASELGFLSRGAFIPSGPFFVLMFYFIYRALTAEFRKNIFIVSGGIFYGLLFYLYFHFWVFATIFLGVLFLIFLITKNYPAARTVFFSGLVGVIVSIPFWINQYFLSHLPSYADIVVRQGIEEGYGVRWFLWKTYVLHSALAAFAIYLGHAFSKKILGYFLAALALTGIIAYNINIVTGFTVLSDHWGNKVFLLTNGILLAPLLYLAWRYVAERKYFFEKIQKSFAIIGLIVVALLTTHVVESGVKENMASASNYTVSSGSMDAYEWLTKNTLKDSVMMTPSIETNIELAAYTHNRIFQARAQNNLLSKAEVLDRAYTTHKFFDIPPEKFLNIIQSRLGVFNFFGAEYASRALDASLRPEKYPVYQLPQGVAEEFLNTYIHYELPNKIPHRLDYLFVGPRERGLGANLESLERYSVLYKNDDIIIYKYNQI